MMNIDKLSPFDLWQLQTYGNIVGSDIERDDEPRIITSAEIDFINENKNK